MTAFLSSSRGIGPLQIKSAAFSNMSRVSVRWGSRYERKENRPLIGS